jgi:hypothetical protein
MQKKFSIRTLEGFFSIDRLSDSLRIEAVERATVIIQAQHTTGMLQPPALVRLT